MNIIKKVQQDKTNIFTSRGCCAATTTSSNDLSVNQAKCCKLTSYNWLKDFKEETDENGYRYVEIRFKNDRKDFFIYPPEITLKEGEIVALEANPGHEIGIVALVGDVVRLQMKRKNVLPEQNEFKKVYRHVRITDVEKWLEAITMEKSTLVKTKEIAGSIGLEMKINDVEYQGDKTKAIFYYTANERVDFRILIRKLAEEFKIKIEMRQIGVRQEAAKLGGIGSCGRELCCASHMCSFKSVSTNAARTQQLSLNPQKLAGQCGKLKCCLNFELDDYMDALKEFPDNRIPLKTKKALARHQKSDVFKGIIWFAYTNDPNNMMAIPVEKVKEIIEMNKKNKFPEDLESFAQKMEMTNTEKDVDFDFVGYI